ncbi:MAG: helix-turn-helix domain-containing protein [Defluviitaleaceae bacterium]|nr:helix-turn-helix domain-containing protein [Defluviitaleaceae bacterium]
MTLAEKIQILRKQKGISQEDLAEQMNITRQAVSKWEQGESTPDVENIIRLSEILSVSTDYLLKDHTAEAAAHRTTNNSNQNDARDECADEDDDEAFFIGPGSRFKFDAASAIWPVAVLIFLFAGSAWPHAWAIFVVAWVVEEVVDYFKTGKLHLSIYGLAVLAYIAAGVFFGLWDRAWLIFVVAWVIDEMFIPDKKE